MAQLTFAQDLSQPATWQVQSDHPGALAAVPDAIVQLLGFAGDHVTCWAVHPHEQDGSRFDAYADERAELGPGTAVNVIEVLRPRQENVVWIDRYHLVASGAPAATASRLLGLYAGDRGSLLLYVHAPAAGGPLSQFITQVPNLGSHDWNAPHIASQARFAVRLSEQRPQQLELACAPVFLAQVQQALQQLATMATGW